MCVGGGGGGNNFSLLNLEDCASLRKTPGYAPVIYDKFSSMGSSFCFLETMFLWASLSF